MSEAFEPSAFEALAFAAGNPAFDSGAFDSGGFYTGSGGQPVIVDQFRVGGAGVQEIRQTLGVSTIYHTQKKTG